MLKQNIQTTVKCIRSPFINQMLPGPSKHRRAAPARCAALLWQVYLWNRWSVIYWSETDFTHRVKKKLDKRQSCISFVMSKNTVYWLAVANWLWCYNIQMFKYVQTSETKQNKSKWALLPQREKDKKKKKNQNMSHRKKNSQTKEYSLKCIF